MSPFLARRRSSSGFADPLLSWDVGSTSSLAGYVEIGAEIASLENRISVPHVSVAAVLGTECSILNGQIFFFNQQYCLCHS